MQAVIVMVSSVHQVLLGVGEIICSRSCRKVRLKLILEYQLWWKHSDLFSWFQVLLLNGTQDRETSGFTASCFVIAIADALNRTHGDPNIQLKNPVSG